MAKFYDTILCEYIKKSWDRWLWLDKLAENYFDYKMISYEEVTNKKSLNFREVDLSSASIYSWEDVYITAKIYDLQKKSLEQNGFEKKILEEIENPLMTVLKEVELNWVKLDRDRLKWIWILLEQEIKTLKQEIYNYVWEEFNINSPKQVWDILFEKLQLPKWKKTKTGYSVNAEVLWDLAMQYPIAQNIVDYRHYTKILSTYVDWLLNIATQDNFLHTSYNQTIAATWRLSSTDPNLQNIPSSHWIAWEIRDAFVSRFEDWIILAADYSQVEVRLLAIMSWDQNLLDAFKWGLDIHHKTAEFIFGKKEISSSERKIAKAVNFGVIYWISSFWLSKMIWIPVKDAKIYIDKFFESYPKVKEFLDNTIKFCEQNWYVETLFWRRRYIKWINDWNKIIKSWAEREAINMPIQWTSADIIKIAMIKISKFFKQKNLKSKMIMQVHDELVFDVIKEELEIIEKWVKEIMEWILTWYEIILKVDLGVGKSWKEAK